MNNNSDIRLSKALSWLLRHGAQREGIPISSEGYIEVDRILQHCSFVGRYNNTDIKRVVETNNKKRFKLRLNEATNKLEIKAHQGHTITDVTEQGLVPILEPVYSTVVHGTYLRFWPDIKQHGLSCMKRQHIHLAKGTLDDPTVVSGLRRDVQIYIFVDLKKALVANIKFFESENGVILTRGDSEGFLRPEYFKKAIKVVTGEEIYP